MSKQKSDQTPDDVEIPVENKEFMDEFFAQVYVNQLHCIQMNKHIWMPHTLKNRGSKRGF